MCTEKHQGDVSVFDQISITHRSQGSMKITVSKCPADASHPRVPNPRRLQAKHQREEQTSPEIRTTSTSNSDTTTQKWKPQRPGALIHCDYSVLPAMLQELETTAIQNVIVDTLHQAVTLCSTLCYQPSGDEEKFQESYLQQNVCSLLQRAAIGQSSRAGGRSLYPELCL